MADVTTRIRLSATDDASAKIAQVKKNLAGLLSSQGMAGNILGGAVAGGVMGLTAGLIDAIPAMGQAAWDMGVMAAQAERTEASFASLADRAGISGQAMLQAMRSASQGTVADVDLMAAANRGLVLGVADSAAEMADLVEAAIIRGRDVGVGATQAVNDLVTGIGRMSPEILDNLGIANAAGAFKEYAATLGTTADKLTEVQKKQALVNAVLASTEGQEPLDDAAAAFERMDAAVKNLQSALGQLFGPTMAAIAQGMADSVNVLNDKLELTTAEEATRQYLSTLGELHQAQEQLANLEAPAPIDASAAGVYDEIAAAERELIASGVELGSTTDTTRAALETKIAALQQATNAAFAAAMEERGLQVATAMTKAEFEQATLKSFGFKASLDAMGSSAAGATVQVHALIAAMHNSLFLAKDNAMNVVGGALSGIATGLMDNMDPDAALGWLKDQKTALGEQYDMLAAMRTPTGELMYTNEEILLLLQGNVAETQKWASGLDKVASGVDPIKQAFDDLKSKVSSMLSGALSPDVSIPEGLVPREDDINENARRVAAIANEGIGDQSWMEEFKNEAPGIFDEIVNAANPQAAAARIFTEFQAGLRPELIDKDLVKQRIKDAILGEQEMSALATEIAQELSQSMGVSLPEALSAAQDALGVKPADNLADNAGDGAAASGQATKFVSAWVLDMKNEYARVYATGVTSGEQWGSGFLSSVQGGMTPALISLLVTLITPEVLARIRTLQTQTGALP
jgi:hypothetical protein